MCSDIAVLEQFGAIVAKIAKVHVVYSLWYLQFQWSLLLGETRLL